MKMKVKVKAAFIGFLLVAACLTTDMTAAPAAWACGAGSPTTGASGDVFTSGAHASCPSSSHSTASSSGNEAASTLPEGTPVTVAVCETTPEGECIAPKLCPDGTPMSMTYLETEEGHLINGHDNCADPALQSGPTAGQVVSAFEQIPVPESILVIQPPGGATLVNFDTNFYTVAKPFERTVTLLGHPVHFRIRPRSFTWHYGDGQNETTSKPGAAYPALDVTHRYLKKGTVSASVDTVWEADFQVDGGPWAPVNGTVTKTGPAQRLTVRSATPILVG